MRFWRFGIAAIIALAVFLGGCQATFQPGSYIDDMGRSVDIDQMPERIVSHVPSITEILFALGLEERVVGVSDFCDYPPEAAQKPNIGEYYNPSIEALMAQDPDLVLTDGYSESIKGLENLQVNFFVINPEDIDGVFSRIELLGEISGVESRAETLVAEMKDSQQDIVNRVAGASEKRVLYIFDATDLINPWTAGPGSFAHELVTLAGGENIAATATSPWVQYSIEAIINADPEVILVDGSHGTAVVSLETLESHSVWQETTAVKEGNIYVVNGDLINRPGPRVIQGLQEIAESLHPELFSE